MRIVVLVFALVSALVSAVLADRPPAVAALPTDDEPPLFV